MGLNRPTLLFNTGPATEQARHGENGLGGRDRTADTLLPKQARYQLRYTKKKLKKWTRRSDSNRRRVSPPDLQTGALGRLATARIVRNTWLTNMADKPGLEPGTLGLTVRRSTN